MSRTGGRPYRRAVADLKARAPIQPCWRCGKTLYADAPAGHPDSITLGHLTAIEDGGDLLSPNNHSAECMKCNYGDGAKRTNRKRAGKSGSSFRNPAY
jgi:hypothetical protein